MSTKYISSAERNRLAKLKFFNENTESHRLQRTPSFRRSQPAQPTPRIKQIDITVPGTPVSSKYLARMKANQNNGEHSNKTDKTDYVVDKAECVTAKTEYVDPFEVFLSSMKKLNDGELKQNDGKDILELFVKLEQLVEKKEFGYNNIGVMNGQSNLKVHPAVRRSLSRRHSLQENVN